MLFFALWLHPKTNPCFGEGARGARLLLNLLLGIHPKTNPCFGADARAVRPYREGCLFYGEGQADVGEHEAAEGVDDAVELLECVEGIFEGYQFILVEVNTAIMDQFIKALAIGG